MGPDGEGTTDEVGLGELDGVLMAVCWVWVVEGEEEEEEVGCGGLEGRGGDGVLLMGTGVEVT